MAKLLFASQIHQRGLTGHVRITSAGTFDDPRWGTKNVGGGVADAVACLLTSREGMHVIRHRAEQFNTDHLTPDLVVAMDRGHISKLERLGVPAERIRLLRSFDPQSATRAPDVADPEFNYEVERVYDEIKASLPGLHDWVDDQLDARPTSGWRVWYVRPADERLTLYSPVHGYTLERLKPSDCLTRDRTIHATCSIDSDHNPPDFRCLCGIYATASVVHALYLVRAMAWNIDRGDPFYSWFPYRPDRGMAPVLTKVVLQRAVDHDDIDMWSTLSCVREKIGVRTPVLRAASVEITHAFVPYTSWIDRQTTAQIADRLSAGFGIKTFAAGMLPKYTPADWDARPEWMRTEPWRTKYRVDSMLKGFTRDGYRKPAEDAHAR